MRKELGTLPGKIAGNIGILVFIALNVWLVWSVVVAFGGGTLPLLGIKLEGSTGAGLLFLLVVAPLAELIFYLAVLLGVYLASRDVAIPPPGKDKPGP